MIDAQKPAACPINGSFGKLFKTFSNRGRPGVSIPRISSRWKRIGDPTGSQAS